MHKAGHCRQDDQTVQMWSSYFCSDQGTTPTPREYYCLKKEIQITNKLKKCSGLYLPRREKQTTDKKAWAQKIPQQTAKINHNVSISIKLEPTHRK